MAREDRPSRNKRFGIPDPGPTTKTVVEKHIDGTAHVLSYNRNGDVKVHNHPHEEAARKHAGDLKGQPWDED
jgi:hypothetical protein